MVAGDTGVVGGVVLVGEIGDVEVGDDDGVEVVGGPDSAENGKFAWILDPEGTKVELWEPMLWDEKNKGA